MSIITNRVIFSDNAVLTDHTIVLNNYKSGTGSVTVVAAQDGLYIGSTLPFNSRYFDVSTANTNSSAVTVSLWDGNSTWNAAVDVRDNTLSSGASLGQSGAITWALDRDKSWGLEDSTEDIPVLSSLKLYDLYWARFTWSADFSASTALKYVGFKFSEDEDLDVEYPELTLSETKTAFQAGKTDWDDQHFRAGEEVIRWLTHKRVMEDPNQILDAERFRGASSHYVAFVAFRAFGDDYKDNRDQAIKDFGIAMKQGLYSIDMNKNTRLDDKEKIRSMRLIRQ
jgi:hypothetical protein